jgi:hypothetical protein
VPAEAKAQTLAEWPRGNVRTVSRAWSKGLPGLGKRLSLRA